MLPILHSRDTLKEEISASNSTKTFRISGKGKTEFLYRAVSEIENKCSGFEGEASTSVGQKMEDLREPPAYTSGIEAPAGTQKPRRSAYPIEQTHALLHLLEVFGQEIRIPAGHLKQGMESVLTSPFNQHAHYGHQRLSTLGRRTTVSN